MTVQELRYALFEIENQDASIHFYQDQSNQDILLVVCEIDTEGYPQDTVVFCESVFEGV